MTSQPALLPSFFPAALFSWLVRDGVPAPDLLHGLDLHTTELQQSRVKLTFPQHARLITNCLQNSGDPNLGIRFGQQLSISNLGMLGYAAMSCQTLGQALQVLTTYMKIRAPLIQARLTSTHETVRIQLIEGSTFGDVQHFMREAFVSGLIHIVKSLVTASELRFTALFKHSTSAPNPSIPFADDVLFDQAITGVAFDKHWLSSPLSSADESAHRALIKQCDGLLRDCGGDALSEQLRSLIMMQPAQFPDLEQAASQLNMSSRTLRRSLQREGQSYQRILDEVRLRLAKEYLLHSQLSIKQIGYLLGFENPPSFTRAFRSWTGVTASQFRTTKHPHLLFSDEEQQV